MCKSQQLIKKICKTWTQDHLQHTNVKPIKHKNPKMLGRGFKTKKCLKPKNNNQILNTLNTICWNHQNNKKQRIKSKTVSKIHSDNKQK